MLVRKSFAVLQRLLLVAFVALIVVYLIKDLQPPLWIVFGPLIVSYAIGITLGRMSSRYQKSVRHETVEVQAPVTGRWSAMNSPADRTPSHGVHHFGQTYAIDVVPEPEGTGRPRFAWLWPIARRPESFPGFGSPLYAVADATVVAMSDGRRDHLSRNSVIGFLYVLLAEGELRGLLGPDRVLGNHVILDLGDGLYAAYAHVQRGSIPVRAGDRVAAGQLLGRCGNSGNTTEPHLHFQLMDGPDLDTARGRPFRWRNVGVPRNGERFTVDSAPSAQE
ncbi:Glycyl-glycine endopeptidase ALE-1 precursor [Streptomyces sp. YIM 130001]|uniref:murein hydrolase activator EnvC family protein n=1 Tax=Streptomyces sp. YIM 130001 TaxID=2259644 RepID=UPI000E65B7F8|nr:M23 family metallopeptidase [Streptomyces sp. YIM 130001]RII12003.1 Glycyl-glycine endopeptidase ALE-1 precursor [Streptomyces sp. YIM 130001]